jgi:hypothetical protein
MSLVNIEMKRSEASFKTILLGFGRTPNEFDGFVQSADKADFEIVLD